MKTDTTKPKQAEPAQPKAAKSSQIQLPSHYVGIGASAGGLEAIETFVKNMPARNGLAFIIIQHLSPDYKSLMVELLSKRTEMQVHRAENGMGVEADAIYLIPPKKNLTIFHGKLILSEPERARSGIFLPIDVFLRSLADDQGEKAIGIILSGTGSDGMRGIRAIKESGGMVMVQDETTAKFDGMPRSAISTGLVDFILPPAEMPKQLQAMVKHPEQARSARSDTILTDEDGLTRIFSRLRERHKVDFTYYKPSTVVRRIERRMTVNHINILRDYVKYLESYPRELSTLYRELLIGVTSFFRDKAAFDLLVQKYLPPLLEQVPGPIVRFWVAGCSTGEEAYTLAMACRESLDLKGLNLNIKIFATDVDNDAVLHAGNGIYQESIAADIEPSFLSKYFIRREDAFQVTRNIREMVVFAQHNLIKDPPFTNIDLISCRNLLIYLQPVLQRKVLDYFTFSLNANGLLLLGHSETTGEMSDYFEPLDHKWKIYRTRGKRKEIGPELMVSKPRHPEGRLSRPNFLGPQRLMRFHEEERILDRLLNLVSGEYVPLTLVVNDQMELLHVLGDSSGILRYPSGRVVNDISRIVIDDLSIPLSTSIPKAFKNKEEVRYTNIRIRQPSGNRTLDMRIKPFPNQKGLEAMAAVFIQDAERLNSCKSQGNEPHTYDVDEEAAQRIEDLEQELQFTRENLQATIQELETSNEELQATNEELLASNEELQSTNQELQSVNEELHTVNTEHQRKIMELTELNNDMYNFMEITGVGTMFLDENMELRKYTPEIKKIFKIVDTDIGRPAAHLSHNIKAMDLPSVIETVVRDNKRIEKEVETHDGYWYLMRVIPYYIGSEAFSGSVLTFIDINELKQSRTSLLLERAKIRMLTENIQDVFWMRAPNSQQVLYLSPAYEKIWGRNIEEVYQDPGAFIEAIHPDDRPKVEEQLSDPGRGSWDVEYRVTNPQKETRWIHDRSFPVHDGDGNLEMRCGFASDVTERKNREDQCLLSLSKFRATFDEASFGIALIDMQGQALETNSTFQAMLGCDAEALEGKAITALIHPEDRKADQTYFDEMVSGKRDFFQTRKRFVRDDGQTVTANVTVTLIRNATGEPGNALCIVENGDGNTKPVSG